MNSARTWFMYMSGTYRGRARKHLASAKALLEKDNDDNLELAALRLRKTMEAVTYEHARSYAEELGPEAMKTWQPKKLMERMLEVDPHADQTSHLSMGIEPSFGEQPEEMTFIGTNNVLNQKTIKGHYDALGSYLHTPLPSQLEKGKDTDYKKLRKRCENLVEALDVVLSSTLWNVNFTNSGEIECMICEEMFRRRISPDQETRKVTCWNCEATYDMKQEGGDQVRFEPRQGKVVCPNSECSEEIWLWERDWQLGAQWTCGGCDKTLRLAMGVSIIEED